MVFGVSTTIWRFCPVCITYCLVALKTSGCPKRPASRKGSTRMTLNCIVILIAGRRKEGERKCKEISREQAVTHWRMAGPVSESGRGRMGTAVAITAFS
ncbi:hypothetical protein N658DRAFT_39023 [Parathielavia hyrcaniae]|uniref:Secreted protein n=1 Tax=Parathielavia hyrcaniae TaxID=113614 RepID=A0AAN6Q2W5_9PEZI|nr:hypothetical protein N658DRAFT_39023 [Parathielavia hyrcaniae]